VIDAVNDAVSCCDMLCYVAHVHCFTFCSNVEAVLTKVYSFFPGHVHYSVSTKTSFEERSPDFESGSKKWSSKDNLFDDEVQVEVIDDDGQVVAEGRGTSGILIVKDAILWWPYSMNKENFGYRYTLKVMLYGEPLLLRKSRIVLRSVYETHCLV
jgi:hypothetical protein